MKMDATTTIARPVETVWAYVSDATNDVNWRTGITESGLHTDGPLRLGTIGYVRVGDAEARWKVISLTDGSSVDWELVEGPYRGTGGYRLVPVDGGTQFTLVADAEPANWLRLLGPIFAWIGQRQNQRDVEKLREILESAPE
jgi:carbon monoxide dehydrogenase subunit G